MDFALALFIALVVTGAIIYWDKYFGQQRRESLKEGDQAAPSTAARIPLLVEYSRAFFPIILVVFLLRSFVIEPFRIPSGSMLPSLYIGDFILVSKFSYGLRLPIINRLIVATGRPDRGDVMVFRFPRDPKTNFIKRVVGLPGDVLVYRDKQLMINGQAATLQNTWRLEGEPADAAGSAVVEYLEQLGDSSHGVLLDSKRQSRSIRVSVPEGQYFVMGDNRDHSNDSRFWGFVPEENIVGRAFFVWFSWDFSGDDWVNWKRIGTIID
ncbi:MAG TPA: signal peptidase I [Gammaproteobacteria bacterium]|jgi:signal peptidase I|nr:signal peptidase I [Arenicellales bacterium]MDP6768457.1 signal peptidase I [Arenicellales bacterium]HCY14141.1 signal peptidase I [Gammaproteobacteria bacterium]|tara:strand:- start:866 stop:1666 length:801 start_codon:yes stop_codon:yes gene_type:complete